MIALISEWVLRLYLHLETYMLLFLPVLASEKRGSFAESRELNSRKLCDLFASVLTIYFRLS